MAKHIIIISGPTATGKTDISIRLALCLKDIEISSAIINFDSLLFYQELNIGTAKPTIEDRHGIEHYLIGISSIKQPLDAAGFCKLAYSIIEKLHREGKIIFLVGGSGFYLRALIKGMYPQPDIPQEIKEKWRNLVQKKGLPPIIEYLQKNDPQTLEQIHPNDHYRLIRAVEYFETTNQTISQTKNKWNQQNPYDFAQNIHPDWNLGHFYLNIPKNLHDKIIEQRVEHMLASGLIEETKSLLLNGFSGKEKPLLSIGYKETIAYLQGHEFDSIGINKLKENIIISTRQLAKAQRTFFKKIIPKIEYNPQLEWEKIRNDVLSRLGAVKK